MSLSVIIVNFRSASLIVDCLHSLYEQDSGTITEVLVVDNASGDNSEDVICTRFPQVKWVQMDYNAGFARANNEGMRRSVGELVLLLNPDTISLNNAVGRCAGRLLQSDYVAAGVQLLNADNSLQISGSYFMTGGINHLMAVPDTGRFVRWLGLRLKVRKTSVVEARAVTEVDWINGAFLMVKKEALKTTGLLDEDFFLYSEEIEWCSRLGKAGRMCIYGDLNVVHLVGVTAGQAFNSNTAGYQQLTDKKGLQLMLSGWLRIRKQFGVLWFLFHLLFFWLSIPIIFLLLPFKFIFNVRKGKYYWQTATGFAVNVVRNTRLVAKILRNTPYFYKVL